MHATTLQFRKVVHKVLDAAQLKCDWSYTDKPRPGRVIGVSDRRYVGLQVGSGDRVDKVALVADINAQLAALGVSTRAEWRNYHIRAVCVAAK